MLYACQILVRWFDLDDGNLKLHGALSLLAAPQILVLSLIFESGQGVAIRHASVMVRVQVKYLGIGMTIIGQGSWFYLVARHPLHSVAAFLLLVPVFSITAGVVFPQETLSPMTVTVGILTIAGVAVANLGWSACLKRKRPSNRGASMLCNLVVRESTG